MPRTITVQTATGPRTYTEVELLVALKEAGMHAAIKADGSKAA